MHVAILGAGPAGMSCANVCLSYGLKPFLIESSDDVGGAQRLNFHANLWMLGAPNETGSEMTTRLARHFAMLGVATHFRSQVLSLERDGGRFRLDLLGPTGETRLQADAVVLATGTRARATPELERLAEQSPRVLVGALAEVIRDEINAQNVLILGGGDNALDHALFLAERGNRVTVRTRAEFSARRPFIQACAAHPAIRLQDYAPLVTPESGPDGVSIDFGPGREHYDWLLVMYGYRPNSEVIDRFAPALRPALSSRGYLAVDTWQRTSVPGLYAAGDLTDPPQPSVPTAIAQGLAAARAIEVDLHAAQG
jgi:thioredoxin reductase